MVPRPDGRGAIKKGNTVGVGRPPGLTQKLRDETKRDLVKRKKVLNEIIDMYAKHLTHHRELEKAFRERKFGVVATAIEEMQKRSAAQMGMLTEDDWKAFLEAVKQQDEFTPLPCPIGAKDCISAVKELYEMSGAKIDKIAVVDPAEGDAPDEDFQQALEAVLDANNRLN